MIAFGRARSRRLLFSAALVFPLLASTPGRASAQGEAFLPEVSLRLKGARYVNSEVDFDWTGWIGGGFGIVRAHRSTAYITADVETIIGSEKRPFDANQAAYHLEGGVRMDVGAFQVTPVFHHVSRHLVDRPKQQPVDWNLVGVRLAGPLPAGLPGSFAVGIGHTVRWRLVHYGWELLGLVDIAALERPWGSLYVRTDVRFVSAESSPAMPRASFVDFVAEGGVRLSRGGRHMDFLVAYEHRNDVYVLVPGTRDRALVGLRVGFAPGLVGPAWP